MSKDVNKFNRELLRDFFEFHVLGRAIIANPYNLLVNDQKKI